MTKVCVIGIGNIGSQHARIYASLNNTKLAGIADINQEKGKNLAQIYNTNFYKDYIDMLKSEKPDAISIAVPTDMHEEVSLKSMKYVKYILLEKPIAHNIKSAMKIKKFSHKYNCNIYVGYVERFNPAVIELKNILKKSSFGKQISITVRRIGPFPDTGHVNVVYDLLSHDIDLLLFLFGKDPKHIFSYGRSYKDKDCDFVGAIFKINDIFLHLEANWLSPVKFRSIAITSEKGYINVDLINQKLTLHKSRIVKDYKDYRTLIRNYSKTIIKDYNIKKEEPLKLELEDFIGSRETIANLTDALKVLTLSDNIIKFINK